MTDLYSDWAKEIFSTDKPTTPQREAVKLRCYMHIYNGGVTPEFIQDLKKEVQTTGGLLVAIDTIIT